MDMKRLVLVLVLVLVGMFCLTAAAQEEAVEEEVTLDIWQIKWQTVNDWSAEIIDRYMEENPNVSIKTTITEEAGGYNVKLLTAIAGGAGPDVFMINAVTKGSYEPRGILAPLDLGAIGYSSVEQYEQGWLPGSLNAFKSSKGELLGLPLDLAVWHMMINTEYFAQAGVEPVPESIRTWDDFCLTAEKLHQKDASGKTVVKGTQLPWGSPFGWYLMSFEPLVWQYGGSVFDEDQMSALDSAAVRNAFEVWNNIHNVYDTGSAPEFQGVSPVVDFANGKSAMVLGHMGSLGVLPEEIKQKTAFLPMPQVDPANPAGVLNAWGFFINRNSTIRDEATKWIDYFMRSAEQNPDITRGAFTPIKGYAQSDTVRQKVGYESATAGMAFSRPREGSQYYDETGAAIKKALEDVVLMGEDKEQVIKALHEQVNKIQSGN
jgi:multiple sugar transport system substrate-binding protein